MLVYLNPKNLLFQSMNRLQASLYLRFIPGLGNIRARKLWEFCSSPEAIFERSPMDLLTIEGIGTAHMQVP